MNATTTNLSLVNSTVGKELTSEELFEAQIGKTVAHSLDKELRHISPKVLQRLEKSREIAINQRKTGSSSTKSFNLRSLFPNLGPLTPVFIVLLLVFGIAQWQRDARINDIADLDTAILTDAVPPDAYVDDGFRMFMKKMIHAAQNDASENSPNSTIDASASTNQPQALGETSKTPDISTNQ